MFFCFFVCFFSCGWSIYNMVRNLLKERKKKKKKTSQKIQILCPCSLLETSATDTWKRCFDGAFLLGTTRERENAAFICGCTSAWENMDIVVCCLLNMIQILSYNDSHYGMQQPLDHSCACEMKNWCSQSIFTLSSPWTKWLPFCRQHYQIHFMNAKFSILIDTSHKFVPKGPLTNQSALVQVMAWRQTGDLNQCSLTYMRH